MLISNINTFSLNYNKRICIKRTFNLKITTAIIAVSELFNMLSIRSELLFKIVSLRRIVNFCFKIKETRVSTRCFVF